MSPEAPEHVSESPRVFKENYNMGLGWLLLEEPSAMHEWGMVGPDGVVRVELMQHSSLMLNVR